MENRPVLGVIVGPFFHNNSTGSCIFSGWSRSVMAARVELKTVFPVKTLPNTIDRVEATIVVRDIRAREFL